MADKILSVNLVGWGGFNDFVPSMLHAPCVFCLLLWTSRLVGACFTHGHVPSARGQDVHVRFLNTSVQNWYFVALPPDPFITLLKAKSEGGEVHPDFNWGELQLQTILQSTTVLQMFSLLYLLVSRIMDSFPKIFLKWLITF